MVRKVLLDLSDDDLRYILWHQREYDSKTMADSIRYIIRESESADVEIGEYKKEVRS